MIDIMEKEYLNRFLDVMGDAGNFIRRVLKVKDIELRKDKINYEKCN